MNIHTTPAPAMHPVSPRSERALRDALGRFATGVTVVTAPSPRGPVSMTANSFTSVSMAPPLVSWSIAQHSRRHEAFSQAEYFSIHVLSADQKELCETFAKDGFALASLPHELTEQNVPVLTGCLARFDCKRYAVHPAGDHSLILGQVLASGHRNGAALTFFAGGFGRADASTP